MRNMDAGQVKPPWLLEAAASAPANWEAPLQPATATTPEGNSGSASCPAHDVYKARITEGVGDGAWSMSLREDEARDHVLFNQMFSCPVLRMTLPVSFRRL